MNEHEIQSMIESLAEGQSLTEQEATHLFEDIVRGQIDEIQLAAAITAIKVRGASLDELTGAAKALVKSATVFSRPDYPFADVVGTGGDGHNTINLSTIAAITAAACGAKIVKHGNRSISSASGSFDLLDALGIDIGMTPQSARMYLDEFGICFLFAPLYHPGLKHAARTRKTLKFRTIFNLLGPLVNPVRPSKILLGAAKPGWLDPIAQVLSRLGCQSAVIVHGSGVDEIAVHGPTTIVEINAGQCKRYELSPSDFGSEIYPLNELVCQDPAENHLRSIAVMRGEGNNAENAAVAVNVAMVLYLFGHENLSQNYATAMDALHKGLPMKIIDRMVEAQP